MPQEEMKVVVGSEGRISIPSALRSALKIDIGDELLIRIKDGVLEIMTPAQKRARAREITQRYVAPKTALVLELMKERRREARREHG
jgi:AbrB family looped-hinge helix DNA binding protein